MGAAKSLTVSGVSGLGVEPSCLGTACVEIGGDAVDASVGANFVVNARLAPTMGATSGGKMLESMESLNNNQ